MDREIIDVLNKYNIVTIDKEKFIAVPLNDVLYGRMRIIPNFLQADIEVEEEDVVTPIVKVPDQISALYLDKNIMAEDVTTYLEIVASCWEYKKLGFQKSILKKAAGMNPVLNNNVFKAYGKGADEILATLVLDNKWFIEQCWDKTSLRLV